MSASTIRTAPAPALISAARLYESLGASDAVADGKALIASVEPVRAALGERWTSRRSQIADVIEGRFRRHLTPADIFCAVGETALLVATPEGTAASARASCYRGLRDVLAYFLGEVRPGDVDVCRILRVTAEHADTVPLSIAELLAADADVKPAPMAAAASPLSDLTSWPLQTVDGQDLRVSFAVDPVMDLKAWAMAGHRIESRIVRLQTGEELSPAQRRLLMPRDFERIDLAALERGMSRLGGMDAGDKPKLVIQLSFASLSNSRTRAALLERTRELQQLLKLAAICELVDVEAGVPASRLADVTGLVRGFFRSVWVQVEPVRAMVDAACVAKASGVTVSAPGFGESDGQIVHGMEAFTAMVKRPGAIRMVTSLPSPKLMVHALAAGFTHATLRARQDPEGPKLLLIE